MGVALTEAEARRFIAGPYASIVSVVTLAAGSRPAAEDAVQEALARAWERGGVDDLDKWVLVVALNLSRSRWRRLSREVPLTEAALPAVEANPHDVDLLRALKELPRRQREVAVLHYLMDLSVGEIATLTRLSTGGVKHALFRARRSLAAVLLPDGPEEVKS